MLQETQFNYAYSPAFMRLQAYAGVSCSNASLWCRNQRQQGGRKGERLSYSLGRMQDGRGYQVAV